MILNYLLIKISLNFEAVVRNGLKRMGLKLKHTTGD